ncbi:MAG TPA: SH3 domain-containing protein, partial [Kofleriaceae bacterium]|nr:SH3 domain-containing protein [Kofleriaceae bacterium]
MRVTARGLHVRSSPDKDSDHNILGTLPHHEVVNATGNTGEWVGFEYGGKPAFAFGRYLEPVGKQAPEAPAVTPTAQTGERHDSKIAAVVDQEPVVAPAKPVEHHDDPKPAPTPVEHDAAPKPEHREATPTPTPVVAPTPTPVVAPPTVAPPPTPVVAPPPTPVVAPPTVAPTPAPAQVANVDAAPAHVDGKAISKILKLPRPLPQVHAFLPPGGAKGNVEVFLFLHGMFAHHDRSHDKGFRPGKDINDPNPDQAMNLAGAMAATPRNLVTLAPVAHFSGEWPLWNELAQNKGFQELLVQSLDQLSGELAITPPLSIGSISIAGHSAGGSGLGEAAKQLGDKIHDMTYEDGGYADKPGKGTGWKDSHDKVAAWLLGGESDKLLRVLLHGEHNRSESTILHSHFNQESLEQTAHVLKKAGVTVTREDGNHDKRTPDKGMYLDHTLHVHGLLGTRTVTVFNMPKANHMQVRNRATEKLITEGRDTEFETDAVAPSGPLKGAGELPAGHADAPKASDARHSHPQTRTKHHDEAPHVDAPAPVLEPKPEPKAAKPKAHGKDHPAGPEVASGPIQSTHPTHGYDRDDKTNLDSFGNPTERVKRTDKNMTTDNHRVFTNQFTTVSKAPLVNHDLKDAHRSLAKGTVLHTFDVNGKFAQVVTEDIKREDNLWI